MGAAAPAPKKSNTGKIVSFSCLGIVALVIVFAIGGAIVFGGDENESSSGSKPTATGRSTEPDKAKATGTDGPQKEKTTATATPADAPVTIAARKAAFKKSVIADGSDYTSVEVTVTNNSGDDIDVNPLYFSVTDANGSKHTAELGVDENQMGTVHLGPGENITGTITGKGQFDSKYVTYTDGLLGDSVRGDVS
ncbi:DUF4352 domain-containing protein [Streptomyces sp. RKAG290]|uniref:DUF4352 domain-containing protein n=1 Tax=Streptomyces sp. RKAG290 TaxID=2888348 RepID=UPI0020336827|nr:DUF4352 domain-containing protein [Streptomyces sp. RKAG290]MCM2415444.1 DUF4352 domain-containing protein [Streptomyces sp. RKAG290]